VGSRGEAAGQHAAGEDARLLATSSTARAHCTQGATSLLHPIPAARWNPSLGRAINPRGRHPTAGQRASATATRSSPGGISTSRAAQPAGRAMVISGRHRTRHCPAARGESGTETQPGARGKEIGRMEPAGREGRRHPGPGTGTICPAHVTGSAPRRPANGPDPRPCSRQQQRRWLQGSPRREGEEMPAGTAPWHAGH